MARRGWSTSNFLRLGSAVVTAAPCTIACWAKTSITGSNQNLAGVSASGSAAGLNTFQVSVDSTNAIRANVGNGSTNDKAISSTTISANTWFHACGVFTSATSRAAYLNGGGKGTNATSLTPVSPNRTSIGLRDGSTPDQPFSPSGTGDIGEVAYWNAALSDADVAALASGIHPFLVRPDALVAYFPLVGAYSPEINLKSNTSVMTMTGTLTQSAHTRIFMPSARGPRRFTTAAAFKPAWAARQSIIGVGVY